ncbi:TELO2-interacting protein 1 homolog [Paramacrobiotus metropolitanus]|uniref:TELO2-interacting protein 1 homolog n=1 Tax=Paramacrobiotus metropolitanus TaxID=2943436 RepID=UPI0024465AD0|nr:TELO2-interacting protein 1 homolog [Paramacrobiotus metropolitanus]
MDNSFLTLQRISLEVMARPDQEILQLFGSEIERIPNEYVQQYQKCLLLPLLSTVKKKFARSSIHEECLGLLLHILRRSRLYSWTEFRDILGCLCVLLKNLSASGHGRDEHFVIILLKTLDAAIKATTDSVLTAGLQNHRPQFELFWSHIVFSCVENLQQNSSRELKMAALVLLKTTAFGNFDESFFELRGLVGGVYAAFLPGVAAACANVITQPASSAYIGQKIFVEVLGCLSSVLCLIFVNVQSMSGTTELAAVSNDISVTVPSTGCRSDEWVRQAQPKLEIIFRLVFSLSKNDSPEVLLALADFCHTIIKNCSTKLSEISGILLRVLVALSQDENPHAKEAAKKHLLDISILDDKMELAWMREFAEEDFVKLLDSLPQPKENSEESLVSQLRLTIGYIQFFDCTIQKLLSYGDFEERLAGLLINIGKLDERMFDIWEAAHDTGRPYSFQFLKAQKSQNAFLELIAALTKCEVGNALIAHLLRKVDKADQQRNEALLVINHLLPTLSNKMDTYVGIADVESVLESYMSCEIWDFTTSSHAIALSQKCIGEGDLPNDTRNSASRKLSGRKTIKLKCGNFDQYLHRTLYSLLEKTVAEMPVIANRAKRTLSIVAATCGYSSASDLIKDNTEVIINPILIRFRHIHRHPKTVFAVRALISHLEVESMPVVAKLVQRVLEKLDEYHNVAALPFVTVLDAVVTRISQWYPVAPRPEQLKEDPIAAGVDYLMKGCYENASAAKQTEVSCDSHSGINSGCDGGDVGENDCDDESEILADEEKTELPPYVVAVSEILKRCAYILPVEARNLRSVVLDVMCVGCTVLSEWKDQLLPVVHKIWQSIIMLHRSSDFLIIRKAFRCLTVMAAVGGSFLRHRVTKEALPIICRFLGEQCQKGLKSKTDSTGAVRQLQLTFLESLPALLKAIEAEDTSYDVLANAVVGYLDRRQSKALNESAVSFFKKMAIWQPDIIYIKMLELRSIRPGVEFAKPGLKLLKLQIAQCKMDVMVDEEHICEIEAVIPCSRAGSGYVA